MNCIAFHIVLQHDLGIEFYNQNQVLIQEDTSKVTRVFVDKIHFDSDRT